MFKADRTVADVAFDDFVFSQVPAGADERALLEHGTNALGDTIAVVSMAWPTMPVPWLALQSRRGNNLLDITDEMERVGHRVFDETFAVDADDASEFRRLFKTSLRKWLAAFDVEHGPLVVLFDGGEPLDDDDGGDDQPDIEAPNTVAAIEEPPAREPIFYVARPSSGAEQTNDTVRIGVELLDHIRSVFDD